MSGGRRRWDVYRSKAQKTFGVISENLHEGKKKYLLTCMSPSWVAVLILLLSLFFPPLNPFGNGENVKWGNEEYKTEAALARFNRAERRKKIKIRPQRG